MRAAADGGGAHETDTTSHQDMADESQTDASREPHGDEVDPELLELARQQARPSILRPILFLAVIALGVWIIGDWWTEIDYFFSSGDPVEVGSVTDLAGKRAENPDWEPDIPHNRYVAVEGVPSRRSQSRKYRYFKLIGSNIYVEQPVDEPIDDPIEREMKKPDLSQVDRTYFQGQGRMIAFEKMPKRYQGVRRYYRKHYGTRFCEQISPEQRRQIQQRRRATIIDNWQQRYENASPQERKEKGLTAEPTDKQIQDILDSQPICVNAYLLRAEVAPSDHWWYIAIAGIFVIFMLVNVYWLVQWVRRFMGLDEPELPDFE